MTVKELIKVLQKYDQNMEVKSRDGERPYNDLYDFSESCMYVQINNEHKPNYLVIY